MSKVLLFHGMDWIGITDAYTLYTPRHQHKHKVNIWYRVQTLRLFLLFSIDQKRWFGPIASFHNIVTFAYKLCYVPFPFNPLVLNADTSTQLENTHTNNRQYNFVIMLERRLWSMCAVWCVVVGWPSLKYFVRFDKIFSKFVSSVIVVVGDDDGGFHTLDGCWCDTLYCMKTKAKSSNASTFCHIFHSNIDDNNQLY